MGDLETLEHIIVVRSKGTECEMRDGPRRLVRRDHGGRRRRAARPSRWTPRIRSTSSTRRGSTAKPKGILHTTGGYLTGVSATHRYVFDLHPDEDVYWCAADVGWVTGHSYIVYGPLANGATSVMYEGAPDYPHKGIWWEIVERYGVTILYTAPTAIRTCIKWGAKHPAGARSELAAAARLGRRADQPEGVALVPQGDRRRALPDRRHLVADRDRRDHDHAAAGDHRDEARLGDDSRSPGSRPRCVDERDGKPIETGQGLLVLTRPWPSMLRTLYRDDERFIETYFKRFGNETYLVGDAARRDEDGYFWVIGRIDDVVNVSGHRLSTAEVESAIVAHEAVAEAAVIGQFDEQTGQAICAFVTLQGAVEGTAELEEGVRGTVAERIGKFARPKRIVWADDLPKTRSGKIMRRLLRDIAEGRALGDVTTLRDPDVVARLGEAMAARADEED